MPIRNIFIRLTANFIYLLRKKTLTTSNVRFLVFTGTSGKTLARSATTYALRKTGYTVVSPPYGYTNELGIVLAALGIESIKLFSFSGLHRIFFEKPRSETYACIELGADWYPDTNWFLKHFKPYGVCLTNTTDVEWVRSLSIIWKEKNLLIKSVSPSGFVCFSAQNESYEKMKGICSLSLVTHHEFVTSSKDVNYFVYSINNHAVQFHSPYADLFPYMEAFGAALTCLHALKTDVSSKDFFSEYKPVVDRLFIQELPSGATLIADTYKAIPQCTEYVLQLAGAMQKKRKIAVLSEMRPVWKNKEQHYAHIALLVKNFNEVYFIGPPDSTKILSGHLANLQIIEHESHYKDLVKKITAHADVETVFVIKGAGYYHFSELVTMLRTT